MHAKELPEEGSSKVVIGSEIDYRYMTEEIDGDDVINQPKLTWRSDVLSVDHSELCFVSSAFLTELDKLLR